MNRRKSLFFMAEIALFMSIVIAVSKWQGRHLLPTDQKMKSPQFTLPSMDGPPLTLTSTDGSADLIYFFAPWCSACKITTSQVESFKKANPEKKIRVVSVALDFQSVDEVKAYMTNEGLSSPVLLGNDEVARAYRINSFPTLYFLNKKGEVINHTVGITSQWGLYLRARESY